MHMGEIMTKKERIDMVVDDYKGIIPYCECFFILSIMYSSKACLARFDEYERLLHPYKNENLGELISSLQQALTYASEISRFFWPSQKKDENKNELHQARGKRLRDAFQMKDSSPISNRKVRNCFEHFDENLDFFSLKDSSFGYLFPFHYFDGTEEIGGVPKHYFMGINPKKQTLILCDEEFPFSGIKEEVERINSLALNFLTNGSHLPQASS